MARVNVSDAVWIEEYFDPDRPVEKTEADARWAADKAAVAIAAVASAFS